VTNLLTRTRVVALACALGIFALVVLSFFVLRPVLRAKRALRLLAAIQVGQTRTEELRKMGRNYGIDLEEVSDTFDLSQQNSVLKYLHLAPETVILMNAQMTDGVVRVVVVRAWVGKSQEFAKISINELDSHYTGCGDVPVCVKQTSSTMWTTVFFVPSVPPEQRARLLSLNTWCLAKIGGCRSSRELFPVAWE
jgi:hypothetical protein